MKFSEWLKQKETMEATTSTADVAHFARPIFGVSQRMYPEPIVLDDEKKHARKKHQKNL